MELLLVRHAIALPAEGEGEEADDARPLSPKGVKRFRKVVRGLRALGVELDYLLTSPKRRALETAEMLSDLLQGESRVTPHLALPPSPALLEEIPKEGRVALVGHEPYLSGLLAWLLLGDFLGESARGDLGERFPLKKGGVAWLEGEVRPGGMCLRALFPPKVFRL
ncbi:MAG: histidine phosphatase family protein [Thermus sp.]|uniref:SixA phosphatase family protein n=1 Tax=Thermus sp. TaxID=275 RepID=UPI0025DE297A|nr:histidine phosphatase family protein [Thermus sp.]MCS7219392.1 histidine phosphatase family protein [Thermus sp.]MDW8017986.1 histidine phosphatase family protein [Thermus sp.]